MPDTDPQRGRLASPAIIKERRSRIGYGMTPLLDSLMLTDLKIVELVQVFIPCELFYEKKS